MYIHLSSSPVSQFLLREPLRFADLETLDPTFYNSLKYMLLNSVTDLDLVFQTDHLVDKKPVSYELKPGGKDIPVTEENKVEYIDLLLDFRFQRGQMEQLSALAEGFYEFIPLPTVNDFTAAQLELFICGKARIDVEDWKVGDDDDDDDDDDGGGGDDNDGGGGGDDDDDDDDEGGGTILLKS
jgi:hypothetical protein